jgi:CRISPR-associated protein Csd1
MILQALYELAQREGLVDDPDYEWKPVRWLITVNAAGDLIGPFRCTDDADGNAHKYLVPRQQKRTSGVSPFFFCDNAQYVLGAISPDKPDAKAERVRQCFDNFRKRVHDCSEATGDPGAQAVDAFLENVSDGRVTIDLPESLKSNDLLSFQVDTEMDCLVAVRPEVQRYWRLHRASESGTKEITCLVSGTTARASGVHPAVKKLPAANTAGAALISFNKPAFWSYGWTEHENATISRAASEGFSAALNRLLDPQPPDPRSPGSNLPRRSLRLCSDTVVCFWASTPSADPFLDVFDELLNANPESVAEVYRSVWRGQPFPVEDASRFYALTISGAQGRAIVRDWLESSVATVSRHLAGHFGDLLIEPITRPAKGKTLPPGLPLKLLLEALSPPGDGAIPPPLASELFESATQGVPYRFGVLLRAIERTRAEMCQLSSDDKIKFYQACRRLDARAALIKAFLNRHKRFHPETANYLEILPVLDPINESPGYLLGQLMAVLERAQQLAMDANATIVDRYFNGASAAPRSVFVRLLKNSQHHLRKTEEDTGKAGMAFLLKRLVDQIADRFDPKANGFPARLSIEQQGLFVLGYHQMRRWLWMNATERSEWDAQFPDAPKAYKWSKSTVA